MFVKVCKKANFCRKGELSGYPASCQPISAATRTREASRVGDEAATRREEASKDSRGRPRLGAETGAGPEAADRAAGAAGEASQDSVYTKKLKWNRKITGKK